MLKRLPTFKTIPQAIGLPFLSSQEDAQLKFRSGDNGIKRLYGDEVVPMSDVAYWAQYYDLFNSAADVSSLISAQDIRQALVNQPQNLANLLLSLSHHLFTIVVSPDFPSPTSSTSAATAASAQNLSKEALNCLRVLGQILVVAYEAAGDPAGPPRSSRRSSRASSAAPPYAGAGGFNGIDNVGSSSGAGHSAEQEESFAQKWLWSRKPEPAREPSQEGPAGQSAALEQPQDQFKITDDDEDADDAQEAGNERDDDDDEDEITAGVRAFKKSTGNPPKPKPSATNPSAHQSHPPSATTDPLTQAAAERAQGTEDQDGEEQASSQGLMPSLADRLFGCTIDLLFCAGFTLPESVRSKADGEKINYVIWEKGVGSAVNIGSTGELDRTKVEVLRFLTILLSSTIYTPPGLLPTSRNLALSNLTHSLERRLVLSLLCSFLNTSLAPPKAAAVSQLPYTHLISKSAEERRTLVRSCMMVLLVALDHPSAGDEHAYGQGGQGQGKEDNAFRYFISKLHRKEDFAFILTGILGVLEEYSAVTSNLLPVSKRSVPYVLETFMLLWRIIELNKYIYESGKTTDLVAYMLLCCLDQKDDPANHGLLRLLSYLLQTLSADQAFAQALVQPVRLTVPAKWAVAGSAADFLIVSIYSIATTPGLNSLFPALTISIANIAPYLQNIGVQASTRLLQLFKAFSAPNFLLADEGHPRLVYYLSAPSLTENNESQGLTRTRLETFNSILYHQLNENPNLVYAVLRSHQDFQTLATFSLMSGLRDIQRRKALRAERAAELARKPEESKGLTRTNSELDMLAEKAALLGQNLNDEDEAATLQATPTAAPIPMPLTTPGETTADPLNPPPPPPPPAATSPNTIQTQPLSEKARGKLRATESISSLPSPTGTTTESAALEIPDEELLRVAAAGVGPNGYVPTQEWVSSWQKGLPLDPVLVAISELLPRIQDSQSRSGAPSTKVFNLLKAADLSDVLPPKPPIIPRRFQWSSASVVWLTSLLWGNIYVAGLTSGGIWKDTTVRLFGVKQAPAKRSAQESVGRMLKLIGVV